MRMKSRMGANVLRLSVLLTYMYMLYVGRDPFGAMYTYHTTRVIDWERLESVRPYGHPRWTEAWMGGFRAKEAHERTLGVSERHP